MLSTNSVKLLAEPISSNPWFWGRRYSAAILRASRSGTLAGEGDSRVPIQVESWANRKLKTATVSGARAFLGSSGERLKLNSWSGSEIGYRHSYNKRHLSVLVRSELVLALDQIVVFAVALAFIERIKWTQEGRGFETKE